MVVVGLFWVFGGYNRERLGGGDCFSADSRYSLRRKKWHL